MGPPTTKRPVVLIKISQSFSSNRPVGSSTGRMTVRFTASMISAWEADAACCVDTTTLLMRIGLPSTYSKETCVLPSGRKKSTRPSLRALVSCCESWCAQ